MGNIYRKFFRLVVALLVSLIRLSRIYKKVRIEPIYASRIGHLINNIDQYLLEGDRKIFSVFFALGNVCNQHILDLWRRHGLFIIENRLMAIFLWAIWADCAQIRVGTKPHFEKIIIDESTRRVPLLPPRTERIVTVSVRDSKSLVKGDGNYHDYRNARIEDYNHCISCLIDLGYKVYRIGTVANPHKFEKTGYFDLTAEQGEEQREIQLVGAAEFSIFTNSGIYCISNLLRKRIVYTNLIPHHYTMMNSFMPNSVFTPKLLRRNEDGKLLSLTEMLGIGFQLHSAECPYSARGLTVVDNDPEEIWQASLEMALRLRGDFVPSNQRASKEFWGIWDAHYKQQYRGIVRYPQIISDYFIGKYADQLLS